MSDDEAVDREPSGRYKRLWMEIEVEVVDEMALRAYELHAMGDGQGNVTGLLDLSVNDRVGHTMGQIAVQAWQAAEKDAGVRWVASSGPDIRPIDATGAYTEFTLPRMRSRRDDGTLPDR